MEQPTQIQNPYAPINDLNTRIRILEGKYNLTRERMLLINQNMIDQYKNTQSGLKELNREIKEIKEDLEDLKETIRNLLKEMTKFARKDQLKILEKYINMWNPLNFMTKEEVLELLEKKRKDGHK